MPRCTDVRLLKEHGSRWLVFDFENGHEYDLLAPGSAQALARVLYHLRDKNWFTPVIEDRTLTAVQMMREKP